MVTARFGADGMSLLLLPGEAECRSPPKGLQRRITTPGLKQLQGPKASVSGTNWSHPLYKSTSYGESSLLRAHKRVPSVSWGRATFWNSNLQWVYHMTRDCATATRIQLPVRRHCPGRQIVRIIPFASGAVLSNAPGSFRTQSTLPSSPLVLLSEAAATRW